MIFWIISALISFFLIRWVATVPCLVEVTKHPTYTYKPVGLKVWMLFLLIFISLIPWINLLAVVVVIIATLGYAAEESITMADAFPKGLPKWYMFFTKTL